VLQKAMTTSTYRQLGALTILCAALTFLFSTSLLLSTSPATAYQGGVRVTAPVIPAAKPSSPYMRPGMWIWYVDQSQGGSVTNIIRRAKRSRIGTLYIKSGDGTNVWSQFTPGLIERFQRAGLKVCGWQYVYGTKPVAEAKVSAVAKRRGADCFVIDAEAEYEGKYAAADRYVRTLRKLVGPKFKLSLSTFPYAHYHPGFPYSVFLGPGAATDNLPQVYWAAIGDRPGESMGITYTYNRMYKRPIFPVGQTYMDPPARDLMRFRALAQSYGTAPSWWSWQETRRSEWQTLAQPLPGPVKGYDPVDTHPTVKRGYRGDSIVWLQQHLIGAGLRVPVTGIFGKQTYRAVRRFQDDRNLRVDGVVGNRTWNRLLRVKPVRVKWSAPRAASARTSGTPAPRAPLSATIPPVRNEIAGAR
jgi:hypothetical protein